MEINTEFDLHLIHYEPSDHEIYGRAGEVIIPRNPVAAARVLRQYRFDIVHYSPLTIYAPLWRLPPPKEDSHDTRG